MAVKMAAWKLPGAAVIRKNTVWTIPNLLSFYRLCAAPVAIYAAFTHQRSLFATLVIISLLSDFFDGLIARHFNQASRIGPRLDSIADDLTILAGLLGVFIFEFENIQPYIGWLAGYLALFLLGLGYSLAKFRRTPALHLMSSKLAAVIATLMFIVMFTLGFPPWLFAFSLALGILANLETIVVLALLDHFRTDQRGLIWVLRRRREAGRGK